MERLRAALVLFLMVTHAVCKPQMCAITGSQESTESESSEEEDVPLPKTTPQPVPPTTVAQIGVEVPKVEVHTDSGQTSPPAINPTIPVLVVQTEQPVFPDATLGPPESTTLGAGPPDPQPPTTIPEHFPILHTAQPESRGDNV